MHGNPPDVNRESLAAMFDGGGEADNVRELRPLESSAMKSVLYRVAPDALAAALDALLPRGRFNPRISARWRWALGTAFVLLIVFAKRSAEPGAAEPENLRDLRR